MLDQILKKLNTSSVEKFFEQENEILKKYDGMEIERENPLSVLSYEELYFLMDYMEKNGITYTM